MTEAEWLSNTFSTTFILQAFGLRDEGCNDSDWKVTAARVACLERLGADMPADVRRWVELATEYLDQEQRDTLASFGGRAAHRYVYTAFRAAYTVANAELKQRLAAAQDVFHGGDYHGADEHLLDPDLDDRLYYGPAYQAESAAHCDIIRDVFGNPFRPVAFDPSWRSPTAVALASRMYEARDFSGMPILADALQDAGCEHPDVLAHCRGPGPHVRGCWVVDLVLDKN